MHVYVRDNACAFEPLNNTAVALGGFDAIHTGHRAIIEDVVDYAGKHGLASVVYMFKNTPREVIEGIHVPAINTFEQRIKLIESLGVDIVVAESFTEEYSKISAESFVRDYLIKRLGSKYVVTGENYHFGSREAGDAKRLKELAEPFGVLVKSIPCIVLNDVVVSSTIIRKYITDGEMEKAGEMLGRNYSVSGTVIGGNHIGRTMKIPTANLNMPQNSVIPKYGVYVTRTYADGKWYQSITNIGGKPTVEQNAECIETHIIGFENNSLYGKSIQVEFCRYIREIFKFESLDKLKEQIKKDTETAKEYFKGTEYKTI